MVNARVLVLVLLCAVAGGYAPSLSAEATARAAVDVSEFVRRDTFKDIKISPTGEYLAATVPREDRTGLIILRRASGEVTASFALGRDTHVEDFVWVNDERVVMGMSEAFGQRDEPQLTGEMFAVNADGSRLVNLVGYRVDSGGAGTRIKPREAERVAGYLVDDLPNDDKYVIVAIWPFTKDPYARAERMDVYTGRRNTVARVPVERATFTTDNQGVVRFARGAGVDNFSKLYYRAGERDEWRLVNDESQTGQFEFVLGFSPDDRVAYLQVEYPEGPDGVVAFDVGTGERTPVFRDDDADPWQVIRETGASHAPVGLVLMDGTPRTVFFDDASTDARLQRTLEAAFAGQSVLVTSSTRDARQSLVQVSADTNAGDFYLFDRETMGASRVISRREWLWPEDMASMEPIRLEARDGLELHGYLTRPRGASEGRLPLVVLPHGGPFGVFNTWSFSDEVQLLARAGYAVLQVNFRGSGNRGRAFYQAGARQWGLAMQDDVTDATRWAIEQGIADPERICIYGASYGAYAALVGAAREPDLYQCAAGYVGVYDLQRMYRDDSRKGKSSVTWLNDWLGDEDSLAGRSATDMADRIKVPVFLAAGGEDEVAPVEHTEAMAAALQRAEVPVETLIYPTEGHGFYDEQRRIEYYTRLLDFLARHLGGARAKPAGSEG
jgi:dipeptidyl aminopeptidase/acylaminoacyl peptidase